MEVNDIVEAIQSLLDFELESENETEVRFKVVADNYAILDKVSLTQIIEKVNGYSSKEGIGLYSNNQYEVLVRNESRLAMRREIEQEDTVNKLKYKLNSPSTEYLVFFLYNLHQQDTPNLLRRGIMGHRLRRIFESSAEGQQEMFERSVLDVIKEIIPRLETIQIESESNKKIEEFERLLFAYIFNLGYNLDLNMQPLRFIDEFTQPYRMGRLRRSRINDIEPPKRLYINDLILHYQKGISSESLDHQYLSFYHVIEHFFEKIYNDDILFKVRDELTKPDFSYKRSKDIKGLVSIIQNKLKYKNEEFLINELEALELTLQKFIPDIEEFKESLNEYQPDLIEFYKANEVEFSKGNRVNFDNDNQDEIYKNLAKRIYRTRNAIVHSKETEKIKYVPFKDDKELLSEIYLLRLVAEFIIIKNSKEL
ncbi:hypothetical protein [uncultured Draconibacterium sp.]|uniref:hypothetical protein n=1 Tax=uncultured Draconibacterium sp. TaxID=1573823 RepID=UPI0029C676BD|nr:hypothetical protein [uncultured Draconibacterium sp.]